MLVFFYLFRAPAPVHVVPVFTRSDSERESLNLKLSDQEAALVQLLMFTAGKK